MGVEPVLCPAPRVRARGSLDDHSCCRGKMITTEEPRACTTIRPGCWAFTAWPSVGSAAFIDRAAAVLPEQPEPVAVLGIDEIRRGRPQWTWNDESACWEVTVDRWHVGFVDLAGGQGLLGQVEGRTAIVVKDWINQ